MDVIKIRLQSQRHSMTDPLDVPKYRNAAHCAYVMVKEEGASSLYKGVTLTIIRQGTNQAANFTVYQYLKSWLLSKQKAGENALPAWQVLNFLIRPWVLVSYLAHVAHYLMPLLILSRPEYRRILRRKMGLLV